MTSIKDKREYLSRLYPGYSWHEKVAGMSQEQVIAVYLRFQRDGFPRTEPKLNNSPLSPEEETKPKATDQDDLRLF